MNHADAIMALESDDLEPMEAACAMQAVINEGKGWRLQGAWGRSMMQAIENGDCMLGRDLGRDYYGSPIPSRHMVTEGTKGSRGFVVKMHDENWADMLDAV